MPIKYYRTENTLENQVEAVLHGVCQVKNGNRWGKVWQGAEALEESREMCLEPLHNDIWVLNFSRVCQLLLDAGNEI